VLGNLGSRIFKEQSAFQKKSDCRSGYQIKHAQREEQQKPEAHPDEAFCQGGQKHYETVPIK